MKRWFILPNSNTVNSNKLESTFLDWQRAKHACETVRKGYVQCLGRDISSNILGGRAGLIYRSLEMHALWPIIHSASGIGTHKTCAPRPCNI